ncbi:MAG: agmatine deiminase family protein, partial [Gemmataceae bacterium]
KVQAKAAKVVADAHADLKNVRWHTTPTNRSWARDSGPIFVTNSAGKLRALDWKFSAWAKYPDWQIDDQLPKFIATATKTPRVEPIVEKTHVVLEGGGIDVNGAGLVLTTEEWLLSDTQIRNPGWTRSDYEQLFQQYLGAKTIWLGDGIVGDDTHGHVDDLARFTDAKTVVCVEEQNPADENYHRLQENLDRLRGTKLNVVALPMPRPLYFRGQRLPASYANFYIANGQVLMPTFNDPADQTAMGILRELFPGREVVGIHAVDLVWGLGTLHCLSQQQPASAKT